MLLTKPYYSFLSPVDQEQMLGIAESHAVKAFDRIKYRLPHMPSTFGLELEPPIFRLRVGYIMADFRHHVTAHLLQTVFQLHDADRFEVFCYALNPDDRSAFRRRIRESGVTSCVSVSARLGTEVTEVLAVYRLTYVRIRGSRVSASASQSTASTCVSCMPNLI